jgi:hypothetical protein
MAAFRSSRPRSASAGPHEAERNGSEQRRLWTTRWQLDADAGNVLYYARADLDRALSDCRELAAGKCVGAGDRGADAVHWPERGGVKNEPD